MQIISELDNYTYMLMGNRQARRASSASPPTKTPTFPRSRNGSNRGVSGAAHQQQPVLTEAAGSAANAATAPSTVGTSDISASSSAASQLQMQHQPGDQADTAQPIQLSQYQKSLLREAWQKMNKKGAGSIGTQIFRRMFAKNPEIKQVFQHVTVIEGVFGFGLTPVQAFHHHSGLFVQVLDSAIEQLDDLRPFIKRCIEFGAKHAPYRAYGFKADMWDVFGQCMTESAREWEGWRKHRETIRAWTILVSFIVDRMRQGYEAAVRRQCFMQQLSTKQVSAASIDEPKGDQQDTAGTVGESKACGLVSRLLAEEYSPRRRQPTKCSSVRDDAVAMDAVGVKEGDTNETKTRLARAGSQ